MSGSRVDTGAHLAWGAMAFIGGTTAQLMQPSLWPQPAYVFIGVAGAAAVGLGRRRWPLLVLALVLVGFAMTGVRAQWRLEAVLSHTLEGRDLQLVGTVASLPHRQPVSTRFEFDVESAWLDGRPVAVPARVSLAWYAPDETGAAGLRAGQRWQLTARLKRPHGTLNPHGFDLELWMFERGLGAGGYVRTGAATPAPRLLDASAGHALQRLRQHLRDAIERQVAHPRAAGVLAALVVGDQGAIARSDWEVFRRTGIAHLVSISGLHVTMFAWLAAGLVGALWRRSPRLMLAWPTPSAARWGGLVLATAYAALAGWGVPAQRTVLMLAAVVALQSLGRRWPLPLVLLAAAWLVTAIDPWALLQPGFWLSFCAVGLLIAAAPGAHVQAQPTPPAAWPRLRDAMRAGLRTQAVATVGLAPLTLLFFQQMSVVGFVANLVAIPLVTLAITPLALLGGVGGALTAPLWSLAAVLVGWLAWLLETMSSWPGAVWTAAAASWWVAVAGLLGGTLLVLPVPPRLRVLGLPLLLPLLAPPVAVPPHGRFEMVAADVGQGSAVLVRTRSHLLVYDSGPAYGEGDAGDRILLPLLRARGERGVDMLMLSHGDSDHVGGAPSLMAALPVRSLVSTLPPAHRLRQGAPTHQPCAADLAWAWDGVHFEVLHPTAADLGVPVFATPPQARPASPNSLSCVLRLTDADGRSALLTGDIEAAQEAALVARHGEALRSTMLLVPHHGSKTSSSDAFLDAVAPKVAVVQAGYRSRFGHPAPPVLARYDARAIVVQRTDRCGAWTWRGEGEGFCQRRAARRYWHDGP